MPSLMDFLPAAATIFSSLMGQDASENASQAQVDASRGAIDFQREMYNQSRADMEPWRQAGVGALGYMTPGLAPGGEFNRRFTMEDFEADPGYAFRQNEALNQWQNQWSARGGGFGGPTDPNTAATKDLLRWSQGLASQEYGNAFNRFGTETTNRYNRLAGVAGTGQTAANTLATAGENLGARTSELMTGIGNARASGYMGGANALSGALGQGITQWQGNRDFDALQDYRNRLLNRYPGQMPLAYMEPGWDEGTAYGGSQWR